MTITPRYHGQARHAALGGLGLKHNRRVTRSKDGRPDWASHAVTCFPAATSIPVQATRRAKHRQHCPNTDRTFGTGMRYIEAKLVGRCERIQSRCSVLIVAPASETLAVLSSASALLPQRAVPDVLLLL